MAPDDRSGQDGIVKARASRRGPVRALAFARLLSVLGGTAAFVALTLDVYRRTGSDVWLAVTMLLTIGLGGVLSPLLGHFGDRFPRRRVMIASDVVAATLFLVLASVLGDLALVLPLAFLAAVAELPMLSASGAAIPNLAAEEDLSWANGLMLLSEALAVMVGPAIGGFLADAWGAGPVLVVNAASFLVSAAIVATVRGRFESDGEDDEAGEFAGAAAGIRFLWRDRRLLLVVLASSVIWFGAGVGLPADVRLAALFDPAGGGLAYGLIIGSGGFGGVVGAIASRRLSESTELAAFAIAPLAIGAALILVGLSPWLLGVLAAVSVAGAGDAITEVAATGVVQRRAPDQVRSRVLGAMNGMQATFYATSFVMAGFVLEAIGPRLTFMVAGALILPAAPIVIAAAGGRRGRRSQP